MSHDAHVTDWLQAVYPSMFDHDAHVFDWESQPVAAAPLQRPDLAAAQADALSIIRGAELDLGTLSRGERRDLLMDNTPWDRDVIEAVEAALELEHPAAPWSSRIGAP